MSTLRHARGVTPPRGFDPDVLFVILDDSGEVAHYVRTPDGVGAYWYEADQEDEARGDVSDPVATRTFDSVDEFDEFRNENGSY